MKNQNYVLLIILCLAVVAFLYYAYRVKIKEGAQGGETEEATGDEPTEAAGDEPTEAAGDEPAEDAGDEPAEDAGDEPAEDAGDETSGAKRSKKAPQQNIGGTKPRSGVQKGGNQPKVGSNQPKVGSNQPNVGANQPNVGANQPNVGSNQPMLNPYESPKEITGSDIAISNTNYKSVGSVVAELEDDIDKEIPSLSRRLNALDKRMAALEQLASKPSGKAKKK